MCSTTELVWFAVAALGIMTLVATLLLANEPHDNDGHMFDRAARYDENENVAAVQPRPWAPEKLRVSSSDTNQQKRQTREEMTTRIQ